jgi:hypothetical protein
MVLDSSLAGGEGQHIDHRGTEEQGRQGLERFLVGRHRQPLEVMEQITYLLFLRRLDELQTLAERKAAMTKKPLTGAVFPPGDDAKATPYEDLRWSRFKDFDPAKMFQMSASTRSRSCATWAATALLIPTTCVTPGSQSRPLGC